MFGEEYYNKEIFEKLEYHEKKKRENYFLFMQKSEEEKKKYESALSEIDKWLDLENEKHQIMKKYLEENISDPDRIKKRNADFVKSVNRCIGNMKLCSDPEKQEWFVCNTFSKSSEEIRAYMGKYFPTRDYIFDSNLVLKLKITENERLIAQQNLKKRKTKSKTKLVQQSLFGSD